MSAAIVIESKLVESSQIHSVGYTDGILKVVFHGGATYLYFGVNRFTYDSMMNAPSIGSFFAMNIKSDSSIKCVKV